MDLILNQNNSEYLKIWILPLKFLLVDLSMKRVFSNIHCKYFGHTGGSGFNWIGNRYLVNSPCFGISVQDVVIVFVREKKEDFRISATGAHDPAKRNAQPPPQQAAPIVQQVPVVVGQQYPVNDVGYTTSRLANYDQIRYHTIHHSALFYDTLNTFVFSSWTVLLSR